MYRTLSICVNETINGTRVYRKEGEGTCPKDKTVAMGRYRNSVNESGWVAGGMGGDSRRVLLWHVINDQ